MKAPTLRAGAAVSNLTPPLGVNLDGPISQNGLATHVHDELAARCLVLDDGNTQVAFVICDSTSIARPIFEAARQQAHGQLSRLPPDHMLMAATHTHSTPRLLGIGRGEPDLFYLEYVIARITDGLIRAVNNLEPAKIAFGSVAKPEYVFNRRWKMKPGTIPPNPFGQATDEVQMNPPAGSGNLVGPAGPVDPEVSFLSLQRADGTPLALLANYGLHYVGGVPRGHISADYFGMFAERLGHLLGADKADPPFVAMMSNGTSGDVNNNDVLQKPAKRPPYTRMREVANNVAEAVARASKQLEHRGTASLDVRRATLELDVRRPSKDDLRWAEGVLAKGSKDTLSRPEVYARETLLMADWKPRVELVVQALRIGEAGIVALPCEVFAETGLAIKKQSPLKPTFTIELANGYGGYLPTPAHHRLGGYETWRARSSFLEIEAEPKLRAKARELLQELADRKDRE